MDFLEKLFSGNGNPSLLFHGAAGTVTGSMHFLRAGRKVLALDAGLFQGRRAETLRRNTEFPVPPDKIDALLLSHAHIDHSGNIPQLARRGFAGRVYCTPATGDLCEIMLADSAHIQEEDAEYWNRKRARTPQEYIHPLYTVADARAAGRHFQQIPVYQSFSPLDEVSVTFVEAGHILGSACVLVEVRGRRTIRILYTGDLGRFDMPILRDPTEPMPQADYLITECTYADRKHRNPTDMKERLVKVVRETVARRGKIIIPSFSVGRTQNVVHYLVRAIHEGLIEPLPIFVDSPLSAHATEVFQRHPECYDAEARDFWLHAGAGDLFGQQGLVTYVTDAADSKALNARTDPHVIVASSGMCEAGRILHHLKNSVWDEKNTICIVGYMAQHTLGRRIVERRPELKIFGRAYPLMARVEVMNGFSAHADQDDFLRLLGPIAPHLRGAFIVHGEGPQPAAMEQLLRQAGCSRIHIPQPGDVFLLE